MHTIQAKSSIRELKPNNVQHGFAQLIPKSGQSDGNIPRSSAVGSRASRSVDKGIGHFFDDIEIDGFIDKDEFKKQIDDWIHVFRNTSLR